MSLVAIVFLVYLLLLLVVGAVAARHGRTMEGYFLADRRLGAWVTSISSVASSESGWLVLGLVGEAYMWGAKAIWTVAGCMLGYLCNWYLVAPRLRQHSARLGAITLPDFFEARLGDRGPLLRGTGILIILFCLMFYVSAQFTATGKAFQEAFGASYGITYAHGVLLGGLITVLYTLVGGFRAVSWTDLVQGILMAIGLIVLPIVTVVSLGGFGALWERLGETPPRVEAVFSRHVGAGVESFGVEGEPVPLAPGVELVRWEPAAVGGAQAPASVPPAIEDLGEVRFELVVAPVGPAADRAAATTIRHNGEPVHGRVVLAPGDQLAVGETDYTFEKVVRMLAGPRMRDAFGGAAGAALLGWIIGLLGIGLGYPGQPQILARFMAARSRRSIRRGRLIAIAWGCLAMNGAVVLGLAARVAVPGLVDPEQAYPNLTTMLLPPAIAGVLLAAIISAMMSTADSQLLVVSSAVARDLIDRGFGLRRRLNPATVERTLSWITRATVCGVGLAALLLALGEVRAIFWFVLFAWSGLGAAFGPPLLLALFWRRLNRWGALAGMLSGFGVTLVWKLWLKSHVAAIWGISLYELVPAFACSLFLTWAVSRLTPPPPPPAAGLEGLEPM